MGVEIYEDWDVFGMWVFGSYLVMFIEVEVFVVVLCGGFVIGDVYVYMECNIVVGVLHVVVSFGIVEVVVQMVVVVVGW